MFSEQTSQTRKPQTGNTSHSHTHAVKKKALVSKAGSSYMICFEWPFTFQISEAEKIVSCSNIYFIKIFLMFDI
jgi:hypothetical protein